MHVELEPLVYRVPDAAVVRSYFAEVLRRVPDLGCVLVADVGEQVVGCVEVVPYPEPPAHQILKPIPTAYVHTVVARSFRGAGVGRALLARAEAWAVGQDLQLMVAGIAGSNETAHAFYSACGYQQQGVSAVKQLRSS